MMLNLGAVKDIIMSPNTQIESHATIFPKIKIGAANLDVVNLLTLNYLRYS